MNTHKTIFENHVQYHKDSCAASAMELVLKLHGLVPESFRGFQDLYGDINIGFDYIADLIAYGLYARQEELPYVDGFKIIEEHVDAGRFPMLSLKYNATSKWHIWIAIRETSGIKYLTRSYKNPLVFELHDSAEFRYKAASYRNGRIHFAVYSIIKKDLNNT